MFYFYDYLKVEVKIEWCLTRSSFPESSDPDEEAPAAAPVLEADQSLSEPAPETAPDTSEQPSSGAVHINDFKMVSVWSLWLPPSTNHKTQTNLPPSFPFLASFFNIFFLIRRSPLSCVSSPAVCLKLAGWHDPTTNVCWTRPRLVCRSLHHSAFSGQWEPSLSSILCETPPPCHFLLGNWMYYPPPSSRWLQHLTVWNPAVLPLQHFPLGSPSHFLVLWVNAFTIHAAHPVPNLKCAESHTFSVFHGFVNRMTDIWMKSGLRRMRIKFALPLISPRHAVCFLNWCLFG